MQPILTLFSESMQVHPSGKVCIFFTNGDVKNTHTDGRVEYYYAEVATWHTTYADGVEVFHFPNGQVGCLGLGGSNALFRSSFGSLYCSFVGSFEVHELVFKRHARRCFTESVRFSLKVGTSVFVLIFWM
jgi:hypothetical protein